MSKAAKTPRRRRIGYSKKKFPRPLFESIAKTQLYLKEQYLVMLAYRLAKAGHIKQVRHDLTRYFDHCKSVALIIMLEFKVFLGIPLIVGLLHDIKEDQFLLKWWDIEHIFGKDVYRGLRIITKERDKDYYWGLRNVARKDWWIILVKFADRLHNMRDILHEPEEFRRRKLYETEAEYPALLDIFERIVPRRYSYLTDYIREELEYACNKIRKSLDLPKSEAFKRVA